MMTQQPNIVAMIPVGGTGGGQFSMADRWRNDPFGTFVKEWLKATDWFKKNNLPTRINLFQPAGYPEDGIMPLDSWLAMKAVDVFFCKEMEKVIRTYAPLSEEFLIYAGSPFSRSSWIRKRLAASLQPYAMQGYTSLALDQSSKLSWQSSDDILSLLALSFKEILIEGQYAADNPWMHDSEYRNVVMADWEPSRPELYIPLVSGRDYVMIKNVPVAMKDAPREEKTAWKIAQLNDRLATGLHCIIEVGELLAAGWEVPK